MNKKLFLMPVAGRRVLIEGTRNPLPEGGCWVTSSTYYQRRLADGDAVQGEPPKAAAAPAIAPAREAPATAAPSTAAAAAKSSSKE